MPEAQEPTLQTNPAAPEETVQSGLLDFPEPVSPADNKQVTPEAVAAALAAKEAEAKAQADAKPPQEQDTRTAQQKADEAHKAELDAAKRDFTQRVLAARQPETVEPRPQPVAPAVYNQTRAEMAAGQKMNEHHANLRLNAPQRRVIDKSEGTMTPVFRPADYVPDPKKGTGNVGARNL